MRIDGSFMHLAYGWANTRPVRKVFYNLAITGLSIAVALVVGTIELAGIISQHLHANAAFWLWVQGIDIDTLGFMIVGMFVAAWAIALAIGHLGHVEERWGANLARGETPSRPRARRTRLHRDGAFRKIASRSKSCSRCRRHELCLSR